VKRLVVTGILALVSRVCLAGDVMVPVHVGGHAKQNACVATGQAVGMDGKVAVRAGPASSFRQVDSLAGDQPLFICDRSYDQAWLAVVYSADKGVDCGVGSPIAIAEPYDGPCKSGWVPVGSVKTGNLEMFRLTLEGLGPLRVGMTVKQLKDAGFEITEDPTFDVNECAEVDIIGHDGIGVMFEEGRVTRIDISAAAIATQSGAKVGFTEAQVRRIYGNKLKTEPHHYDPKGHYMKVFSADRKRALVFETDGNVVTMFRAGAATSAEYVEGCL
jgi:hypothetical protein